MLSYAAEGSKLLSPFNPNSTVIGFGTFYPKFLGKPIVIISVNEVYQDRLDKFDDF